MNCSILYRAPFYIIICTHLSIFVPGLLTIAFGCMCVFFSLEEANVEKDDSEVEMIILRKEM